MKEVFARWARAINQVHLHDMLIHFLMPPSPTSTMHFVHHDDAVVTCAGRGHSQESGIWIRLQQPLGLHHLMPLQRGHRTQSIRHAQVAQTLQGAYLRAFECLEGNVFYFACSSYVKYQVTKCDVMTCDVTYSINLDEYDGTETRCA